MAKKTAKKKYSFINELYEGVMGITEVAKNGSVKLKRSDLKELIETTFNRGAKLGASCFKEASLVLPEVPEGHLL